MESKNILVVDDSEFDRNLLVNGLSRKGGYKTLQAGNEEQCLEVLKKNKINLMLMDIMMPGTLGSEVLVKVRKSYNSLELPIIMVTAKGDTSDIVECLQKGANDYIMKPINFEVAVSRISTHLKISELSLEMAKLNKLEALNAMITTYNHEINNPLTIAISCLNDPLIKDENIGKKLHTALWRIADIVKKISLITYDSDVEMETYAQDTKMIKL
ncbi:response regulator [Fluviispira multicolorata]|uniref:Response regulator n=1 Tax=Fluviispira multicolorata TaxID=2654512 RepID=A0A833N305_9BACT|nr:response regulator [Fluviispira multicolorata]KAB8027384.1 response regulator [Fluviispira multicolorata]